MSSTLPETNSSPLKIGHPKRKVVFQPSIFRGELLVSGRVFVFDETKVMVKQRCRPRKLRSWYWNCLICLNKVAAKWPDLQRTGLGGWKLK